MNFFSWNLNTYVITKLSLLGIYYIMWGKQQEDGTQNADSETAEIWANLDRTVISNKANKCEIKNCYQPKHIFIYKHRINEL